MEDGSEFFKYKKREREKERRKIDLRKKEKGENHILTTG